MQLKVIVCGAAGKMGSTVVKAIHDDADLVLVGAIDSNRQGTDAGDIAGIGSIGIPVSGVVGDIKDADVMVDFTSPATVEQNVINGLKNGNHIVIGTTGLTTEGLARIEKASLNAGKNVFIAPNFAIGAVLMIELAKKAAKYMDSAEIIELHHNQKLDAPSGTAIKTAKELGIDDSKIHSVRLPGLVAHQEVIFGSIGQTLTIRHDSIDRVSFMPGVIQAIKAVPNLRGVTIGLEKLLEI